MVERSSVRSIGSSPGCDGQPGLCRCFDTVAVTQRLAYQLKYSSVRNLGMAVDDRTEQLPFLAGEFHHLDLFDRIEIRRRRVDADTRDVGVDLGIAIGNDL